MSELCDQFRVLVDKAVARTPALDAASIRAKFASEFTDAQPAQRGRRLHNLIRRVLTSSNPTDLTFQQLRRLRKALKYQSISGLLTNPYDSIAHRIRDACRVEFIRPFSEEDVWLTAIDAARSAAILDGDLPDTDRRATAVTEAARRLVADGYRVRANGDHFDLDPNELHRLCSDIEADVRLLGGGNVVIQTFEDLRARQEYEGDRYISGRNFGFKPRLPSLPIGYLLNLGIKHLSNAPIRDKEVAAPIWRRLARRARDLCALYDTEPYTYIENILLAPREVPAYLGSIALFDHLFTLRQWRPSETVGLLRGILGFVDETKTQSLLGWTLDDACRLAELALNASGASDFTIVQDDQITSAEIDRDRWMMMRRHFVHGVGEANRDYVQPVDAPKSDFGFKPFIEIHNKRLVLLSASLFALGFFEATTRALRDAGYPNLDEEIGNAIEQVIAGALRAHGLNVTIQGSTYHMYDPLTERDQVGECDVVVETPELIVFIEAKKKPHRRVSATGDPLANLIDLSGSLFDAQTQLARHERILLHHNHIAFDDGKRLVLEGRGIERIALTMLDYGSLQDKFLLKQLFVAMAGVSLGVSGLDSATASKLALLNDRVALLNKEAVALAKLGQPPDRLFLNCWFLSVPQLLMLLDGVEDPGNFVNRLRKLKFITWHTLDFYRDFSLARRAKLF